MKQRFVLICAVTAGVARCGGDGGHVASGAMPSSVDRAVVERVVDGDTLSLRDGWKVRFLPTHTPELGTSECYLCAGGQDPWGTHAGRVGDSARGRRPPRRRRPVRSRAAVRRPAGQQRQHRACPPGRSSAVLHPRRAGTVRGAADERRRPGAAWTQGSLGSVSEHAVRSQRRREHRPKWSSDADSDPPCRAERWHVRLELRGWVRAAGAARSRLRGHPGARDRTCPDCRLGPPSARRGRRRPRLRIAAPNESRATHCSAFTTASSTSCLSDGPVHAAERRSPGMDARPGLSFINEDVPGRAAHGD